MARSKQDAERETVLVRALVAGWDDDTLRALSTAARTAAAALDVLAVAVPEQRAMAVRLRATVPVLERAVQARDWIEERGPAYPIMPDPDGPHAAVPAHDNKGTLTWRHVNSVKSKQSEEPARRTVAMVTRKLSPTQRRAVESAGKTKREKVMVLPAWVSRPTHNALRKLDIASYKQPIEGISRVPLTDFGCRVYAALIDRSQSTENGGEV